MPAVQQLDKTVRVLDGNGVLKTALRHNLILLNRIISSSLKLKTNLFLLFKCRMLRKKLKPHTKIQ